MSKSAIIIGAGHAGVQAALSLRDEGFDGKITLIGEEAEFPYQRPPLSKAYLLGKVDEDGLALKGPEIYQQYDVELITGAPVTAIDPGQRRVALGSSAALDYDHLVLATGARQRRLGVAGEELDGIVHLRSLSDARTIAARLDRAPRVVVIGAGFIGLEFAAVGRAKGLDVIVVELGSRVLGRALSVETSQFFLNRHLTWGAHFIFGVGVDRFEGAAGSVQCVVLSNGVRLEADLVIVGAGVTPNTELASAAGLKIQNGVVVDAQMRTSDAAIWAAGDCAAHPNPYCTSGHTRVESVQNAADQARIVACGIVGKPEAYSAVPWFWSDQGDLKLQIAGLCEGHDKTVVRGDPASGAFSVFCFLGDRLLAVESVNRGPDHIMARRLLLRGVALSAEQAADESLPLKSHLAAS